MINDGNENRPLSPHLTIYRPQFTSVMSILHRITGVSLILGILVIITWFCSLALGPRYFDFVTQLIDTFPMRVVLIMWLWALWYHFFAGLRHIIWDMGLGLDFSVAKLSAGLVIFFSTICFLATYFLTWMGK